MFDLGSQEYIYKGITFNVEIAYEEYPDLSWLGEYTDKHQKGAIDRTKQYKIPGSGEVVSPSGRRSGYRYIISQHWPHSPTNWEHVDQKTQDTTIAHYGSLAAASLAYALQDYLRLESYNQGDWCMLGVTVSTPSSPCPVCGHREVVSRSLRGVESDSGGYIRQVVNELCQEVMAHITE